MTSIPSESNRSFRERALRALHDEAPSDDVRSCFAQDERYCLFASSFVEDKGVEFLIEFPLASGSGTPSSLDARFELRAEGNPVFEGIWRAEAFVDGQDLAPEGPWETVCVDPSDAYAFCERSIAVSGGRRFSRRVCLAYNESLLLVADELLPSPRERRTPRERSTRAFLPFAREATARTDREARETLLVSTESGATLGRVFPIGLPEWRGDASRGELADHASPAGLELTTRSTGATLFAPLIFDFNVRRAARPCSWRPLTVGENMSRANEDDAVGRKLQLGTEQFVLYASTSEEPAIRSILSRNLLSDFMFGKFLASRGVVPILDVEVDEEQSRAS